ncbi:hypothetical protein [uncultured Jannaschia sp.]|nr:hypothetical protein [uncultured Jannaschia sp.]
MPYSLCIPALLLGALLLTTIAVPTVSVLAGAQAPAVRIDMLM